VLFFDIVGPVEVIGAAIGFAVLIALHNTVTIIQLRERVSRLEEWIRQQERRNGER